jgi:hypothetical protein
MNNVPAAVPLIDPLDISGLGNGMAMSMPIPVPLFGPVPAIKTTAEQILLALMPNPAGPESLLGVDDGLPQSRMM